MRTIYHVVLWAALATFAFVPLGCGYRVHAQSRGTTFTKVIKPVDIRFNKRTVAVADENNQTLTLIDGAGETWVCAPYEHGRSCKPLGVVVAWLLAEGER